MQFLEFCFDLAAHSLQNIFPCCRVLWSNTRGLLLIKAAENPLGRDVMAIFSFIFSTLLGEGLYAKTDAQN